MEVSERRSLCRVVNIRHEECDVYVGRPGQGMDGPFGNPFKVGVHGKRGECRRLFREWFYSDAPEAEQYRLLVKERIKPGDKLGCFCGAGNCHADTIAEYVNNGYARPAPKDLIDPWLE